MMKPRNFRPGKTIARPREGGFFGVAGVWRRGLSNGMVDVFNKKKRSEIMSRIRSRGNQTTEVALIRLLRRHRITGWRRGIRIFGKPDFVFLKAKIAIFVDGCFWHGHPQKCRMPATNRTFWTKKIARNIARDKLVTRTLRKKGWTVLRIWEDCVAKASTLNRIRKALP
jgi:DNA mismatch endonuclease, patch repair protein